MATQTLPLITLEAYLALDDSEYPPEYVDGRLVERELPQYPHSKTQRRLVQAFSAAAEQHGLHLCPELHLRVAPRRIRIADFCVFADEPTEGIPSSPPLIVIEILSPGEKYSTVVDKFADYERWGVGHIFLADPERRTLTRYESQTSAVVDTIECAEPEIHISADAIFGR